MSVWILTVALAQILPPQPVVAVASSLWFRIDPQETVVLFWDIESGTMPSPPVMEELGPDPIVLSDSFDLHAPGDFCVTVPSDGLYSVYAEIRFELDESGSRSVLLFADGALVADSGPLVPDQVFQMRAPVFKSEVTLLAGQCLEVRTRAEGHGDLPFGLGYSGLVFALWDFCPVSFDLTLDNLIVVGERTYEACNSITAINVEIRSGGNLILKAGQSVAFENGFSVESGGLLSVILQ